MRRIRYQVAASLDGFIAGPEGDYDWIVHDPEIDFAALHGQFGAVLMGRTTYQMMLRQGGEFLPDLPTFVFSRTLDPADHPEVTVVADDAAAVLADLRRQPGKDVWLFGGGELFRSLLSLGEVDTVEVAVIPVLLGEGIPLLPPPAPRTSLTLTGRRVYESSGIVLLEYAAR